MVLKPRLLQNIDPSETSFGQRDKVFDVLGCSETNASCGNMLSPGNYGNMLSPARRLFEEDHPLEIVLDGCCAHRNSKLVLRDNTYSTIQWDAFTLPELTNFIQILEREEDIYISKMEGRFKTWRMCISQALKDSCMVDVSKQTMLNVASSKTHSISPKTLSKSNSKPEGHHKRANSPVVKVK